MPERLPEEKRKSTKQRRGRDAHQPRMQINLQGNLFVYVTYLIKYQNFAFSPPKVQDDVKCPVGGLQIKQRIMEFQKQHLLAASEALYAVLADMKAQGEVSLVN